MECSGKHRGLGVHLSFVRSVTMDKWKESELEKMKAGGNRRMKQFLVQYGSVFVVVKLASAPILYYLLGFFGKKLGTLISNSPVY